MNVRGERSKASARGGSSRVCSRSIVSQIKARRDGQEPVEMTVTSAKGDRSSCLDQVCRISSAVGALDEV